MSSLGPTKSSQAFRTIAEAAGELDVPAHVLRFWEGKFTQLRPLKRAGGRRHYRPDDMALLRGIRALLQEDGYQLKGVQKILRDQGVAWVRERGLTPGDIVMLNNGGEDATATADIIPLHEGIHAEVAFGPRPLFAMSSPTASTDELNPRTRASLRKALINLQRARQLLDPFTKNA